MSVHAGRELRPKTVRVTLTLCWPAQVDLHRYGTAKDITAPGVKVHALDLNVKRNIFHQHPLLGEWRLMERWLLSGGSYAPRSSRGGAPQGAPSDHSQRRILSNTILSGGL
jgi:hypothetical protein